MGYAIYDKKKNKFPYTDDAPYKSVKTAKKEILEMIIYEISYEKNTNRAIYYYDNLVVKQAPLGFGIKAPVKAKRPYKISPVRVMGRPKPKKK